MDRERMDVLLKDLSKAVAFPETPNMVDHVLRHLPARVRRRRPVLRLEVAIAALVVALTVALPGPRRAVADLLGLGGVTISILPELPTVPAASEFTGAPMGLEEAQADVDFELLVPEGEPAPDLVLLDRSVPGGLVTMVYSAGDGTYPLVITQMPGHTDMGVLEKAVGPDGTVQAVTVGDDPGFWVEGQHVLFVIDASGELREDQARLVGNTLLLIRSGVTVRIESGLDLDGVLEVADALVRYSG